MYVCILLIKTTYTKSVGYIVLLKRDANLNLEITLLGEEITNLILFGFIDLRELLLN